MWHDGLYYKLHKLGICSHLLKSVVSMHTGMYSCVMYNGFYSDWFPILQGTRQGGVWSPFLYLVYIDSLIEQLVNSNLGFQVEGSSLCAPSFADDMTLLSLSSKALQSMIDICYQYSCLWRYQYNASKCAVVTFNESKRSYSRSSRAWSVGFQEIPEKEEFVHLGLICSKYSNSTTSVKHIDRKLRCTLFGLITEGLHRHGLNPLTSYRIYKSIDIPRALFGCELTK